ncbi:alpha/beta fold hydrolase [Pseudonocardia eucalypti]|uniref:Alpha/beta fold hydrolase n=1 Tax=Pseudonocardia eucalypti TaxID=648755 RepID=A0ABP9PTE2_9PSEU|nr:pimeloyl-ACP methyl ester carboxylesterase [Pseudonocardia eucalypti]
METVELGQGRLHYTDTGGSGPVVVLVHGLLVNGSLWRDVVPALAATGARVVVPALPLGSHPEAMRPDADLTPPGIGRLISDFIAALDLREVTLVGNDTGGAMCQVAATKHGERLARLVLTNCDTHDNFLPPAFRPMQWIAHVPGAVRVLSQVFRWPSVLASPLGFGLLAQRKLDHERLRDWAGPVLADAGARRDLGKVLRGIHTRYTLAAAEELRRFGRPILLAWGDADRFFPISYAERLAAEWPDARLVRVPGAGAFVPVDQPDQLARLIAEFIGQPSSRAANI